MPWMLVEPLKQAVVLRAQVKKRKKKKKLVRFNDFVSWVIVLMCWMEFFFFSWTHTYSNGSVTLILIMLTGLRFLLLLFISIWKMFSSQSCKSMATEVDCETCHSCWACFLVCVSGENKAWLTLRGEEWERHFYNPACVTFKAHLHMSCMIKLQWEEPRNEVSLKNTTTGKHPAAVCLLMLRSTTCYVIQFNTRISKQVTV